MYISDIKTLNLKKIFLSEYEIKNFDCYDKLSNLTTM